MFTGSGLLFFPVRLFRSRATFRSRAQNALFCLAGATSLISNMTKPDTQIHRILSAVSPNEILPMTAYSTAPISFPDCTAPSSKRSEYMKQTPVLTAGGRREADIATPTRLLVFPPNTDKQTPIPEGMAMAIPVMRPLVSPRLSISVVGHVSSAICVKAPHRPTMTPTKTQPSKAMISLKKDSRTRGQSPMRLPNVRPNTGPIIGDTSMDATMTTVLFMMSPTPARILAMTRSDMKSKVSAACSDICSLTCSILSRVAAFFHSILAASIMRSVLWRLGVLLLLLLLWRGMVV
mmetsp:Transcript_2236/g.3109  ORF Transcript_2236/g.3109 Transcript_2236/m.3109 type:complete len:292 (-) Transcript_2236:177-1052(-)